MTDTERSEIATKRIEEAWNAVLTWDGKNGQWFYISFADNGFLGACIVRAPFPAAAPIVAHRLRCNPGGEALTVSVPEEFEDICTPYANRLLTKKDIVKMEADADAISRDLAASS